MSADTDTNNSRPNGIVESDYEHIPSTPPDATAIRHPSSQQSIPSTEGPNSPIDPTTSFKTEVNDDRNSSSQVIPSSLTPPPSSQVPQTNGGSGMPLGYISSQRANMFSPPATTLRVLARDGVSASDYVSPTPDQIADAPTEELRTMVQACLAENARLKMETAHHKLQYNLLSMQADEDAKRAAVEHDMTRREVEVLRMTENSRQARRELNAISESKQIKYRELQAQYESVVKENEALQKRIKSAMKLIQQQAEERDGLIEYRDMLLNRIRENREHFHMLCSPGGVFHGALTPKTPAATSPQQYRATPRQTPKTQHRDVRPDGDMSQAGFAALLQALSHDSAPSTPTAAARPTLRAPPRHTRGVQSLSSLPTTPTARTRGDYSGLLPSIDLVPQTEPPNRYGSGRYALETPVQKRGRQSRESTISADDNEELARAALESVAAATQSYMSQESRASRRGGEEEEVFESQASQAASEMLRRDPRESFEVASSVGSRDGTPAPAEKSAKLQSKLFAGLNKAGLATEKRKFSSGGGSAENHDSRREALMSPAKKMRYGGSLSSILVKSPSDVVILSSLRTPICRSYRGQLKDAYPEELLSVVLRATLDANPNLPPEQINDVAVGVVLSELGGSKAARMAMNHVGFPSTTSLYTVNRACSSSLQSITTIATQIRADMIRVGIAAGMESMTRNYGSRAIPVDLWPELKESAVKDAQDCIMPMGLTSENVARRYKVGRKEQDEFAVESHRRAAKAQNEGLFDKEIVPVRTRFQEVDKQGNKIGEEKQITVTKDDGIRTNATLEALAKLKPAFSADGASTAGNSSQVSDGAAATLLMRRSTATELGLTGSILGKFVAATTVGCAPDEMGIGPALAIPQLLKQLDVETKDVDRWEINEAFASQAIYCVRELGLEKDWEHGKVNPDGGAIALGHPLGATGARMASTLMHGLERSGGEVGVVSMCIGTGMGMAGLFVRE
ncbi:Thiolase, N-terminal domain-containing protein [Hypomontagnella monticulosa]|nr:Thiolase, N-terminal domain-containing protein [Hypomontagnella monticulosa]